MSLEENPTADDTPDLADALTAAVWGPEQKTQLFLNSPPQETVR